VICGATGKTTPVSAESSLKAVDDESDGLDGGSGVAGAVAAAAQQRPDRGVQRLLDPAPARGRRLDVFEEPQLPVQAFQQRAAVNRQTAFHLEADAGVVAGEQRMPVAHRHLL